MGFCTCNILDLYTYNHFHKNFISHASGKYIIYGLLFEKGTSKMLYLEHETYVIRNQCSLRASLHSHVFRQTQGPWQTQVSPKVSSHTEQSRIIAHSPSSSIEIFRFHHFGNERLDLKPVTLGCCLQTYHILVSDYPPRGLRSGCPVKAWGKYYSISLCPLPSHNKSCDINWINRVHQQSTLKFFCGTYVRH